MEWLGKLVALGPPSCRHVLESVLEKASPALQPNRDDGNLLVLAIQLSPASESLRSKIIKSNGTTNDDLTKYETCLKGRLQEVNAASRRLNKQIEKEYAERKAEEAKQKEKIQLELKAKLAEQAKEAAAQKAFKQADGSEDQQSMNACDVHDEVSGFLTHSCFLISESLELSELEKDMLISGDSEIGIACASVTVGKYSQDDDDASGEDIARHEVWDCLVKASPLLLFCEKGSASSSNDVEPEPKWLSSLLERMKEQGMNATVICPDKNTLSDFVFSYKNHRWLQQMMSLLDCLATSSVEWATMFPDPSQVQVLKMLRSVLLQHHETNSFFCGTYDMLAGRAIHCVAGYRFIAGLPIKSLFACFETDKKHKATTIAELALWLRNCCSLDMLMQHGFYVLLQAGDVFVVPPAYMVVEGSLGVNEAVVLSYPAMPVSKATCGLS